MASEAAAGSREGRIEAIVYIIYEILLELMQQSAEILTFLSLLIDSSPLISPIRDKHLMHK